MLLHELFSPEHIYTDIKAEEKSGALSEIVDFLVTVYNLNNKEEILEKIWKREVKMSTGLKDGFAFPHAKLEQQDCCYGVLGVSQKGVNFEALNGEPVHVIFLLVDSVEDVMQHLLVLKRMAQLVKIPDFYNEIIAARSPGEAYIVIKKFEELI